MRSIFKIILIQGILDNLHAVIIGLIQVKVLQYNLM